MPFGKKSFVGPALAGGSESPLSSMTLSLSGPRHSQPCAWRGPDLRCCAPGMGLDEGEVGEAHGLVPDGGGPGARLCHKAAGLPRERHQTGRAPLPLSPAFLCPSPTAALTAALLCPIPLPCRTSAPAVRRLPPRRELLAHSRRSVNPVLGERAVGAFVLRAGCGRSEGPVPPACTGSGQRAFWPVPCGRLHRKFPHPGLCRSITSFFL